jgi:potassium efflux system protein
MTSRIRHFAAALFLALVLPATLIAQATTEQSTAPDYSAWEITASRVERALEDNRTPSAALEYLRTQIVIERNRFLNAQGENADRIATIRSQIVALGPIPADGGPVVPDIEARRVELTEQLARLQAPSISAEEAFRRADGMVREIDRILRERQADALLALAPAPVNPVNWPAGLNAVLSSALTIVGETQNNWADPANRAEFRANLPVVFGYLMFALILLARGRQWMETATQKLLVGAVTRKGREIWAFLVSLGQIVVPLLGVAALSQGLNATSMTAVTGEDIIRALPAAGFALLAARWIGGQMFPVNENAYAPIKINADRRREGRFHALLIGLVLTIDILRVPFTAPDLQSEAANAVLIFPMLVVAGLLLVRVGQLLRLHSRNKSQSDAQSGFFDRLTAVTGNLAIVLGVVAPVLAGIGYVSAAQALLYPAIASLGLLAIIILLQRLVSDIYCLITKTDGDGAEALVPALIGVGLVILSIPVFALIWGVRAAELLEIWQGFREGISLGETRISPTKLLTFFVVFALGYTITRAFQGALSTSVLPKTKIEKGGQKSIVAGVGYFGIFLAALLAFSTAGIDLSGLAIVAGALSVGIGFGLQTIVSNFVSGIILLIERPVSEGDWIEVGSTMGIVRSISVRATVIETFDHTDVIVPNADLIAGTVTNWTRYNNTGRLIVPVGVAYGTNTREVERILLEIAMAQPLATLNPPPSVMFMGFGADSMDFQIRVVLRDVAFKVSVMSDINHEIARRFAEENIEIPFAQRDVWLRNPEVLYPKSQSPLADPAV